MTQISSTGPDADGRGMISADDERKPWLTALEGRFAQAEPNLSAGRQGLLRNILDHAEETYFLSSRALAKRCDLDPTTIVRRRLVINGMGNLQPTYDHILWRGLLPTR